MPLDTNFCNGSGGATKWHETIQNMSFRPKVVDWACLLQKTRNRCRGINSCIKCTSIPVFATCQVRLHNGMEPPKTRVLDIKDVVRNQIDILEHRNGVKIPKILVLDLKEWIEILHVVCLESYYSETFNQMHHDTSFHNRSGASTKWRKTFENMSFGPKVVDWVCSLQKNKKWF